MCVLTVKHTNPSGILPTRRCSLAKVGRHWTYVGVSKSSKMEGQFVTLYKMVILRYVGMQAAWKVSN